VYTSQVWDSYCDQQGLTRELSARYRHDDNGVVERGMGVVGGSFRCMMIHGSAPAQDQPDALVHANVIRNNSPTRANQGRTPNEAEAGMKLPINKRLLKAPLFCLCFAHVYEEERAKHEPRGIACVYCGFDELNNVFKVKEWTTGKRYYNADVTFHPDRFPYRANPTRIQDYLHQYDDVAPHSLTEPEPTQPTERRLSTRERAPSAKLMTRAQQFSAAVDLAHNLAGYFVHQFGQTDPSWPEAMHGPYANDWVLAKLAEQNSFLERGVYTLVERAAAQGKRVFKPKVVLKIKLLPPTPDFPLGQIDKFKYRLTIAAYTRMLKQGVDYAEKHASTVRWPSIKILIAIAVKYDLDIVLFDIKTFFLYGELEDEVYMEQEPSWVDPDKPARDWICRLNKSMYGLP
jgi:hypothetical protein